MSDRNREVDRPILKTKRSGPTDFVTAQTAGLFRGGITRRVLGELSEQELEHPNFETPFKVVWYSVRSFFVERPGQIIGSAFLLIMLWGYHGNLELLQMVWPDYRGPSSHPPRPVLIPGIPWDNELISFLGGFVLLVCVPIAIIRFGFKQPLANFGLGLPKRGRRRLAVLTTLTLIAVSLVPFLFAVGDRGMQSVYPLYRPFASIVQFLWYELSYVPFFITIEFIFRGYLLFGLTGVGEHERLATGEIHRGRFYFHRYAILISMLSYTAWHLGKPLPELWGTPIWGLAAGALAYTTRSIWPVVIAHWALNVLLDYLIVQRLHLIMQ